MKADSLSKSQSALASAPGDEGGLELGQVISVVRRKILLVLSITTTVALLTQLKTLSDKPIYSAGFEILTKSVTVENQVISSVPQTLSSGQQTQTANETLDETKIKVLQSPTLLTPLLEKLKPKYPDLTYEALVRNLKIATNQADILAVNFQNEDSALVKDVLTLLSKEYLQYSLEERQRDIRQGISFVEEQLPILEASVARQQIKLQLFRQQYNLIDPELQAEQLSTQTGDLAQSRLDIQTQLSEARLLYAEVQQEFSARSVEDAAASALTDNPRYQKLLDQLLEIDSQLAKDSALYEAESPDLEVLQEQRQNLIPLLQREGVRVQREVASQIQELENQRQAVEQSLGTVNQQVRQLSLITREYTDIQRELQIATDNLNQFLAKREGLRIDASQREVPWQLLTPPNQPIPSAASAKQRLVLGVGLGLLLGLAAALLSDRLSNMVHSPKEIRDVTRLPLLGVIPLNRYLDTLSSILNTLPATSEGSNQLPASLPQVSTPFQEAFRALYANLRFISPDNPIRSLIISSSTPATGKTTIAIHLAAAAAAAGQRVLLIDADLRRPRLHHYLNLSASPGLTDVVSSELDLLDVVQPITWESNLFVLPCGSIPPDPSRILASQSMQRFMTKAREAFDLVIYDMPPVLGFADPYFLSTYTDGMLLAVRLHHLKRSLLERTMEELRVSAVPILGVVANASEEIALGSYSYYNYTANTPQPEKQFLFKGSLTTRSKQLLSFWKRPPRKR